MTNNNKLKEILSGAYTLCYAIGTILIISKTTLGILLGSLLFIIGTGILYLRPKLLG